MVDLQTMDPDQTPHSAASDLGLHCLPVTHLEVSSIFQSDISRSLMLEVKLCTAHLCSLF